MKQSTITFIIAEACMLCFIGINQLFVYQFNTMDLHEESTGEYYDDLVKTRDNIIANSDNMNMLLGVLALFSLAMFIVYNVLLCGKSKGLPCDSKLPVVKEKNE